MQYIPNVKYIPNLFKNMILVEQLENSISMVLLTKNKCIIFISEQSYRILATKIKNIINVLHKLDTLETITLKSSFLCYILEFIENLESILESPIIEAHIFKSK